MAIGYAPPKNELLYHYVDYENVDVIKAVIRNFDKLLGEAENNSNYELFCILIDVKSALHSLGISSKQAEIVDLFSEGLSLVEIGESVGLSKSMVEKHINNISKKISNFLLKKVEKHQKHKHIDGRGTV